MKLSKRGEYALRALIDLGIASELGWPMLQISELASKEKLPIKFLEQIFTQLKAAGYVKSRGGKFGGYSLARPMNRIKFGAVVRLIDGPLAPIRCVSRTSYARCSCPDEVHCGLRMLMLDVRNAISTELEQEIAGLKKRSARAPVLTSEGKTKTQVTSDGKTYVEKLVPELVSAEKWKLFSAITELELFGDLRLRYEYRGGRLPSNDPDHPNDWQERERERYRLRVGLRGTVLDDWFFGLRLETSASARSTNVTFGGDTSSTSPGGGGPFAKGDDGVYVGQAYGGYKGFPGFTFTGGRMPNPFVNTRMVWDDDINPEGLAEQWKHTFTIGGGAAAPVSYSKDGKNVAAPPPPEPLVKIDVFANFGQFVYDDSNPSNPIGPLPTTTQPIGGETQQTPLANAFMLG